jgi:hypothetical protein
MRKSAHPKLHLTSLGSEPTKSKIAVRNHGLQLSEIQLA